MNLSELRDAIAAVTEDQLLPFGACSYNVQGYDGKSCIVGALMTADERAALNTPDVNRKDVRWLAENEYLPKRFAHVADMLFRIQRLFDDSTRFETVEDFKKAAFDVIDIRIGADLETAN